MQYFFFGEISTCARVALSRCSWPLWLKIVLLLPCSYRIFLRLSGTFCEHGQVRGQCLKIIGQRSSSLQTNGDGVQGSQDEVHQEDESQAELLHLRTLPFITQLLKETVRRQRAGARVCQSRDGSAVATILPSFVEFDMAIEGFGCLFLPSLAPQRVVQQIVDSAGNPSAESTCVSGVGLGKFNAFHNWW